MQAILDASTIIDFLRMGRSLPREIEPVMSSVTIGELYSGSSAQNNGSQRQFLDRLIDGIKVIMPTINLAKLAGELKYRYKLSLGDSFLVALAIDQNLPLVTLDKRLKIIKGLKLIPGS